LEALAADRQAVAARVAAGEVIRRRPKERE
jgi:hypothetical protein